MSVKGQLSVRNRTELLSEMDSTTKDVALAGDKKLATSGKFALMLSWDLGNLVNKVMEAKHLNEVQRKQEVKRLAAYWKLGDGNVATLYDLRNVSITFDREFIEAQSQEPMANGQFLTWSHFKELQKVDNEKRQLALLKQIRQHCWSSNDLGLELRGKKEATVKRSGGRKPGLPKTPFAILQKMFSAVQQTDNFLTAAADPLDSIFMELPASEISDKFVESIDQTLDRVEEMQQHLKDTVTRLNKVKKRAVTVLEKAEAKSESKQQVAIAAKKSAAGGMEVVKRRGRPPKAQAAAPMVEAGTVEVKRRRGRPKAIAS